MRTTTIISWNIMGIPTPFAWTRRSWRARQIGGALAQASPDVVLLQEAFSGAMRAEVRHALGNAFCYDCGRHRAPRGSALLCSGLWALSKYPLRVRDRVFFDQAASFDRFASKGAVLLEAAVEGQPLRILHTHLQAHPGCRFAAIRTTQLQQISDLLMRHDDGVATIIAGDLNIDATSENTRDSVSEYSTMLQSLGATPSALKSELRHSIGGADNTFSRPPHASELLDHVLETRSARGRCDVAIRPMRAALHGKPNDLSDHHAVVARVRLDSV